jgi:xylulokinase
MVRAVMEWVAFNLAWLRPPLEAFVGNEFASICFGGGAAQSDLWAQMMADALDRPVHQLEDPRATNARGAAFLAFCTLGQLSMDDVPSLLRTRAVATRSRDSAVMDAALARLIAFTERLQT